MAEYSQLSQQNKDRIMERTITLLFVGWIIGMICALSPSISEIKSLQLKIENKNEVIDSLENELIIIKLLK